MIRQYYYDQLCVQYHQSQVAQVGADHHWQVSQLLVTIWSHSSSSVLCPVLSRASATKDLKTYPLMIIKTFVNLYPLDKEDEATQFFFSFFSTHFSLACQELKIISTQLQPLDTKDQMIIFLTKNVDFYKLFVSEAMGVKMVNWCRSRTLPSNNEK